MRECRNEMNDPNHPGKHSFLGHCTNKFTLSKLKSLKIPFQLKKTETQPEHKNYLNKNI